LLEKNPRAISKSKEKSKKRKTAVQHLFLSTLYFWLEKIAKLKKGKRDSK
jgi:hypothetical protein